MRKISNKEEKRMLVFCENVRLLRKREGLTQKEMAERLKVSVRSISMIENGIVPKRLSCDILFKIHFEFGIDPTDLLKNAYFEC